jgi:chromosome segregation ATPase
MRDSETALQRELSEARRELVACDREVERLRGLLVQRDAELGELRGWLNEVKAHARRLKDAAESVTALFRGIVRLPAAALRGLAGRRPRRG